MKQILSEKEIVKSLWLGRVADLQFQQEVERELIDFKLSILKAVEKWAGEMPEYTKQLNRSIILINKDDLLSFLSEARKETGIRS